MTRSDNSSLCHEPPVVDLYIASIPSAPLGQVYPPARQAQIDDTTSENMRRQRYYVWKLLEYGLQNSFGFSMAQLTFHLDEAGKWSCGECFFSLSHCQGAVAVAVSTAPIGVDIEPADRVPSPGLAKKILSQDEQTEYDALPPVQQPKNLLESWCRKESLFKATGEGLFSPRSGFSRLQTYSCTATAGEKAFCCAVATEHPEKLRIYQNISLE